MSSRKQLESQLENLFSDTHSPSPDAPSGAQDGARDKKNAKQFGPTTAELEPVVSDQDPGPGKAVFDDLVSATDLPDGESILASAAQSGAAESYDATGSGDTTGSAAECDGIATTAPDLGRWQPSLRRTLIVAFLAVAILPTLTIAAFGAASQRNNIRTNVISGLEIMADLRQNQFAQWLDGHTSSFALLARDPDFVHHLRNLLVSYDTVGAEQSSRLSIDARLSGFQVRHPEFTELVLLDRDGRILISTDPEQQNLTVGTASFFTQGKEGSYYGTPDYQLGRDDLEFTVSEPVRSITGEALGVLVGLFAVDAFDELIDVTPDAGIKADTYFLDRAGTLLTFLDQQGPPFPGDRLTSTGIHLSTTGGSGQATYKNHAGQTVLGAYRWLPNEQMALVVEQRSSEAFRSIFIAIAGTVFVALAVVTLTALVASQVADRIARPIIQITEAAEKMVQGDLDQSVTIHRKDEIGALAGAFNHMASKLRGTIAGLETMIGERTLQLQQATDRYRMRSVHLEASAEISRAAAAILEPHKLMQTTVELIRDRFELYQVSLFLLDEPGSWATVRAASGEAGAQLVAQPHRLAVGGGSMVGWVCAQGKPRVALDVGADAVHFNNPLLPRTRSEMVLPLSSRGSLLGALDVQSIHESAFNDDDVRALQGMADLIAVALQNATLFAESHRGVRHQTVVSNVTYRLQNAMSMADVLTATLEELGASYELEFASICLDAGAATQEAHSEAGENGRSASVEEPRQLGSE